MANTSIEWTDARWNPVTGCTKVSPGCAHCYAETVANRFWTTQYPFVKTTPGDIGPGTSLSEFRPRQFTDVQCHEDRLDQPLRWRKPRRVFVNSMSDLFHKDVPDDFIRQCLCVMAIAHRHTFQVLTKRAERMLAFMQEIDDDPDAFLWAWAREYQREDGGSVDCPRDEVWPLPNVWLGVSVENQQMADERIPLLLQTPAAVRFLSCEPLLEAVEIRGSVESCGDCDPCIGKQPAQCSVGAYHLNALHPDGIHWVIVGGESGPRARQCEVAWVRSIVRQCRAASVPCFVKQLGSRPAFNEQTEHEDWLFETITDRKGGHPMDWPEDLRVREWPTDAETRA